MSQILVVIGACDAYSIGVACGLEVFNWGARGVLAWFIYSWDIGVNEVQGFIIRGHLESIDFFHVAGETPIK